MFRTNNPAFSRQQAFQPAQTWADLESQGRGVEAAATTGAKAAPGVMTIQGAINKTAILLTLCIATAAGAWMYLVQDDGSISSMAFPVMFGSMILGFVLAMVCCFAPKTAMVTAPAYAIVEGVFIGGISALYASLFAGENEMLNTGLIFNAALLTFGILGGLLAGYTTRLIRPGPVFRKAVVAATLGLCLYGLLAIGLSLFGSSTLASVYDPTNGGLVAIGFSLFVVVIASANLVLDFEFIESGARNGAPRHLEWFAGFGLLVTLVWLYIAILRLLGQLMSRD
ncbi:MAG: Bax inhibitor-1/YccA family protein [Phycisphaerales bacterium]